MKKAARRKKESFFKKQEEIIDTAIISEEKVVHEKMKRFSKKQIKIGGVVIIIIVIIVAILGFHQYQMYGSIAAPGGKLSPTQISNLIAEVGDKMIIPKGETPTIATVTDIAKLESQPFFKNAQNGDKVLIFGSTNTAILYRPTIHKIVMVSPVNAAQNPIPASNAVPAVSTTPSLSITPTPSKAAAKLKVVVLNSTKTVGLAKKGAALIDTNKADVTTSNAVGEYDKTTISSVSTTTKLSSSELSSLVSGFTGLKPAVAPLPTGESVPVGADVVIILGNDFANSK